MDKEALIENVKNTLFKGLNIAKLEAKTFCDRLRIAKYVLTTEEIRKDIISKCELKNEKTIVKDFLNLQELKGNIKEAANETIKAAKAPSKKTREEVSTKIDMSEEELKKVEKDLYMQKIEQDEAKEKIDLKDSLTLEQKLSKINEHNQQARVGTGNVDEKELEYLVEKNQSDVNKAKRNKNTTKKVKEEEK